MTTLSVNVNKIALLRNSRGHDYPHLLDFVQRCVDLGVKGITVHPRPDERHVRRQDAYDIGALLADQPDVEFNIEGYPSPSFLQLVSDIKPDQCTLVPDDPAQLTSDHGWDVAANAGLLQDVSGAFREQGIRSSLFLDADAEAVDQVASTGADRIELYTEDYARAFATAKEAEVFSQYERAALRAVELGLGVNAGHDLNLDNLGRFLQIPGISEVSIGHGLVVECLEHGISKVLASYLQITGEKP